MSRLLLAKLSYVNKMDRNKIKIKVVFSGIHNRACLNRDSQL